MKYALLAAAAIALPFCAQAKPISTASADGILTQSGLPVEGGWSTSGTARLRDTRTGDIRMTVRLGNCDESDTCQFVMLFATFDLGVPATLEDFRRTNHYNDSHPLGRAFLIEGKGEEDGAIAGIDYVIDLSGDAEFDPADIEMFQTIVATYINHWTENQ